jgi:hypothetical protein
MVLSKPSLSAHNVHKEIYSEGPKEISLRSILRSVRQKQVMSYSFRRALQGGGIDSLKFGKMPRAEAKRSGPSQEL